MTRNSLTAVLAAAMLASASDADTISWQTLELPDGGQLEYALVLPKDFDPAKTYPTLLALPPGPQTRDMVNAGLSRYWGKQAARKGWIVASPIAPDGLLFFQGSERHLPHLMQALQESYSIEGGRFYLAGNSNGGRSAFRIALTHPDKFHALLALPGFPPSREETEQLDRLKDKPVRLFVGGDDDGWVERMQDVEQRLNELGGDVTLKVLPGEGHVPPSLDGNRIMRELEKIRSALRKTKAAD